MDISDVEQCRFGHSFIMVLQALGLSWVSPDLAIDQAKSEHVVKATTSAFASTVDLRAVLLLDSVARSVSNQQMMGAHDLADISIRIKVLCHPTFPDLLRLCIMTKRVVHNEVAAPCDPYVSQHGGDKVAERIISTAASIAVAPTAPGSISAVMDRCEHMTRAWQQTWGTLKWGKDEHLDVFLERLNVELGILTGIHPEKGSPDMLPMYVQSAMLGFELRGCDYEVQKERSTHAWCPTLPVKILHENLECAIIQPLTLDPKVQPVIEHCEVAQFGELFILGGAGSKHLVPQPPSRLVSKKISRRHSSNKPVQTHVNYPSRKFQETPCVGTNPMSGNSHVEHHVTSNTNATDMLSFLGKSDLLPLGPDLDSPHETRASQASSSIPSELAALQLEDALIGDPLLFGGDPAIVASEVPNGINSATLIATEHEELINWNDFNNTGNTVGSDPSSAGSMAESSSLPAIWAKELLQALTRNLEEPLEGLGESLITERSPACIAGERQAVGEAAVDEVDLADLEELLGDI
eukprot:CAMPEP_0184707370 /NCGR_PEP_ID=MMETSP0313-20130426/37233_1 /TAXON_ID=2792 /ORGANISM="Porphyridium aerugineum, Strain SAG 1380-2" /LENGTH=522 /DNA_ID=CAMNT_0027168945 /DNA_START=578 /DNA_END=2146 /DNA_ORIENTATION=-